MIAADSDILLITEPGQELEGKNRLARIGFDRVVGYLDQPYKVMFKHRDEVEVASRLTAHGLRGAARASVPGLQVVDVRNPGEVADRSDPGCPADPGRRSSCHRLDELDRHEADRRVLRRRIPLVGCRQRAAPARFRRRERHPRRLCGLGGHVDSSRFRRRWLSTVTPRA